MGSRTAKGLVAVVCATLAGGCARGAYVRSGGEVAANPTPADAVSPGTLVSAQVQQPLSTDTTRPGDRFSVELLDPLVDGAGHQVVARGAILEGVVAGTHESKVAGQSAGLQLRIEGLKAPGEGLIPLPLEVAESPVSLRSTWKRELVASVGGGVIGAGTGVAITRTQAGVVVGSTLIGIGLGALLAYVLGTRDATLPGGSIVTLRVTRPLELAQPVVAAPCPVPASSARTP